MALEICNINFSYGVILRKKFLEVHNYMHLFCGHLNHIKAKPPESGDLYNVITECRVA